MISVKVARIPGNIYTLELEEGTTAREALVKAEITLSRNDSLKINGVSASLDTVLNNNDRVGVAEEAKGNV